MKIQAYDYDSPRWTQEILDCSMPMTFDTYSTCAFSCQYCFAFYQKSHVLKGYMQRKVRAVAAEKVERLFKTAITGMGESRLTKTERQFLPYIRERYTMQWGALADEFDWFEREFGQTLRLLIFFDEIDYPLSLSTKGTWWTKDSRYMDLFAKHAHNWHVKISIITPDAEKARKIEIGVPSPDERLEAIRRLSQLGVRVTLRLRPYMIGVSEGWEKLIQSAAEAGAESVTTEFLCIEGRADKNLIERYERMSKVAGFDILKFYREHSPQHGYKRLAPGIKRPIFEAMRETAHKYGLRFLNSDAAGRDYSDAVNCCGVPPDMKSQDSHFGKAVLIAKQKGEVRFSDIEPDIKRLFGGFEWVRAANYNTGTNRARAKMMHLTMADWFREAWNDPRRGVSPAKMYAPALEPDRLDADDNIIYKYTGGVKD